jgi:hypothetical protein
MLSGSAVPLTSKETRLFEELQAMTLALKDNRRISQYHQEESGALIIRTVTPLVTGSVSTALSWPLIDLFLRNPRMRVRGVYILNFRRASNLDAKTETTPKLKPRIEGQLSGLLTFGRTCI